MNQITKDFFELIKKGDLDQVILEREKLALDLTQLVDENNQRQNVMFSASQVKDDEMALRLVRYFHELGVSCNQPDSLNQTALYFASREGLNNTIEYFVQNGCNVNHVDNYGQNPFFYCVREGHMSTI